MEFFGDVLKVACPFGKCCQNIASNPVLGMPEEDAEVIPGMCDTHTVRTERHMTTTPGVLRSPKSG